MRSSSSAAFLPYLRVDRMGRGRKYHWAGSSSGRPKEGVMYQRTLLSGLAFVLLASGALADEPAPSPGASLELRFELSRHLGGNEVSRSTHTLRLTADDVSASLSTGVEMPVWTVANNTRTTMFKDIGTSVTCAAKTLGSGRFELPCEISQHAPFSGKIGWGDASRAASGFPLGDQPEIRMFGTRSTLFLGDGETARWVTATDPVTLETIQVEATLKVRGGAKSGTVVGKAPTPLELSVEIDRHRGATQTACARYVLRLAADGRSEVKAGVMSPIRNPDETTTFKNHGTYVGSELQAHEDGRYRLSCEIGQNGPYSGRDDWAAMGAAVDSLSLGGAPVARMLRVATVLYLRAGETAEWPVGTDPVTGETVGIRMTLKALK